MTPCKKVLLGTKASDLPLFGQFILKEWPGKIPLPSNCQAQAPCPGWPHDLHGHCHNAQEHAPPSPHPAPRRFPTQSPEDAHLSYLPLAHIYERALVEACLATGAAIGCWQVIFVAALGHYVPQQFIYNMEPATLKMKLTLSFT